MKKLLLSLSVILSIIMLSIADENEVFENFSEEYIHSSISEDTLLIIKYRKITEEDTIFRNKNFSAERIKKFIQKENKHIDDYNKKLELFFSEYYTHPFKIIEEEDLSKYPVAKFPFVYNRNLEMKDRTHFAYSRYFLNRDKEITYENINLYTYHPRERVLVDKDIIIALSNFLYQEESK